MAKKRAPSAGDALLKDVIAHPDEDGPCLIYADWLEENGRPERAEFIRVQVELARLPPNDSRRKKLAAREEALWDEHFAEWRQEVPHWARDQLGFQRGFARHARATAKQWAARGPDLHDAAPVTGVWLKKADKVLAEVLASPCLGRLHSLSLTASYILEEGARALAATPGLSSLDSLDLTVTRPGDEGVKALAASPHLANLRELTLGANRLGPASAEALAASPHLRRLTRLGIPGNKLGRRGAQALAASPILDTVTRLDLYETALGDAGAAALAASPHLGAITELGLARNKIGPEGAAALAASPHLGNVRRLYLHFNLIGDEGARALAASPALANVEDLSVSVDENGPGQAALRKRFGKRVRLW
jgi:uncharacterized protein (TIGR02996 family)